MKLLVAVDGSNQSLEAAGAVGSFRSSEVVLVHAIDPAKFHPALGFDLPIGYSEAIEQEMCAQGDRYLRCAEQLVAPLTGRVRKVIEIGSPGEVILWAAREELPDLVLVGARGLGLVKELVMGSVSHDVLAHAPCPVLVIRESLPRVDSVLAAIETEDDAASLLDFLATHPFQGSPGVHVVTVSQLYGTLSEFAAPTEANLLRSMAEKDRRVADDFAKRVLALDYRATCETLVGTPAEVILQEADRWGVDLIIMASRGRNALSRFLLGSTGHAVVHRAKTPVLVVRGISSMTIKDEPPMSARRVRVKEEVASR